MDINSSLITNKNYDEFNSSGLEGKPLKIGFFNRMLRDLNTVITYFLNQIPSVGTMKSDTLSEYTTGSGVTVEGVLLQDGKVGATNAITATSGGTGAGQITAIEQFIVFASSNVNNIISLPLLSTFPTGGHIQGTPLNTGCELRVHPSDQVETKYINGVTGGNELKLNNGTGAAYFDAVKININKWIVATYSSLGGPTTIVPDK